jgi:hypothetical protein
MGHFRLEDWADFSRGLAPEELTVKMRDHLSRDCDECGRASAFVAEVAEFVPREASMRVPENDIRRAKALAIGAKSSAGVLDTARELFATLIFDSRRETAPAGIRGAALPDRHLVFASGDYRIEVRLEDDQTAGTCAILGQIFHDNAGAADVTVVLSSEDGVHGSALTNTVGEFEFESAGHDVEMRVLPHGSTSPMVIALEEIDKEGEARPLRSRP